MMNEYELAKAQQAYSPPTLEEITKQQADRIAELEKLLEQSIGSDCREMRYIQEIENKDAQIAELEELLKIDGDEIKILQSLLKEKQSEPVAWWTGRYEDEGEDFMFPNTRQAHFDHPKSCTHKFFPIPLYTTPQTKPLSDEEKIKLYQTWLITSNDPLDLFRAIEERHNRNEQRTSSDC